MRIVLLATILLIFVLLVPGCQNSAAKEQEYRLELIKEIKAFESKLGFTETENFRTCAGETEAYDYYFYTSNTGLPYSLDDPRLQFGTGTRQSVSIDLDQYDVYFYSIQALAGIQTPVTKSLIQAPLSRFLQVIFHEDWHEQIGLPLGIEEPSAEVIGYSAALLFAEEKWGRNSEVYGTLKKHLDNRLRESRVYALYYGQLDALYTGYHSGAISEAETLRRKNQLLAAVGKELQGIWGARPDQLNNAFIAFQMTYLRYLPLMYEVLSVRDFNLSDTIAIFRSMPGQGAGFNTLEEVKEIEKEVAGYLDDKLREISQRSPYLWDTIPGTGRLLLAGARG